MIIRAAASVTCILFLSACGRSGAPAAPKGWQPIPGVRNSWTSGGATPQQYSYHRTHFGGTLQDLASAVTINVLIRHRGARFRSSVPFTACPGSAGIATFTVPGGATLVEGFTVSGGDSIRTTYIRPPGTPNDPNVTAAMQSALCIAPA